MVKEENREKQEEIDRRFEELYSGLRKKDINLAPPSKASTKPAGRAQQFDYREKQWIRLWHRLPRGVSALIDVIFYTGSFFAIFFFPMTVMLVVGVRPVGPFYSTKLYDIEFKQPKEADFLSLQEKLLDAKSSGASELSLTIPEYNAYLRRIPAYPAFGYCVQKVMFNVDKNKPILYLLGSGYTRKKLTIKIEYSKDGRAINSVVWNKDIVPQKGLRKRILDYLLKNILSVEKANSIKEVFLDNFPTLEKDGVKIKIKSSLQKPS